MVERTHPWSDSKKTAGLDVSKPVTKYEIREITTTINVVNNLKFDDKRYNVSKTLHPRDNDRVVTKQRFNPVPMYGVFKDSAKNKPPLDALCALKAEFLQQDFSQIKLKISEYTTTKTKTQT
jgi:hypothetical protein